MKENDFKEIKESVKTQLLIPHYNLFEEFNSNMNEIISDDYLFDRDKQLADIVNIITKEEIINLFDKYFINKSRRVRIVELFSQKYMKKIDI